MKETAVWQGDIPVEKRFLFLVWRACCHSFLRAWQQGPALEKGAGQQVCSKEKAAAAGFIFVAVYGIVN